MKYKLIIVVIGARGGLWDKFRKIWQKYCHNFTDVRTHFVYGGNQHKNSLMGDLVFENSPDTYPPTIHKTLESFRYIDSNYDYDFILRTNLSSFWNIPRLLENLKDLPPEKCYAGDGPLIHDSPGAERIGCPYLSGTDTIVSKDVVKEAIKYIDSNEEFKNSLLSYDGWTLPDDKAMGLIFFDKLHTPMTSISDKKNNMVYLHEADTSSESIEEVIHNSIKNSESLKHNNFRIKNTFSGSPESRINLDPLIMNTLYKYYYANEV